jgi:hypothetical protein
MAEYHDRRPMERMSKQFNASLILDLPRESRWT